MSKSGQIGSPNQKVVNPRPDQPLDFPPSDWGVLRPPLLIRLRRRSEKPKIE